MIFGSTVCDDLCEQFSVQARTTCICCCFCLIFSYLYTERNLHWLCLMIKGHRCLPRQATHFIKAFRSRSRLLLLVRWVFSTVKEQIVVTYLLIQEAQERNAAANPFRKPIVWCLLADCDQKLFQTNRLKCESQQLQQCLLNQRMWMFSFQSLTETQNTYLGLFLTPNVRKMFLWLWMWDYKENEQRVGMLICYLVQFRFKCNSVIN